MTPYRPVVRFLVVRALAVAAAALYVLVATAGGASAHAYLQGSTPAGGTVLRTSPPLVTVHFSEGVGTSLASVVVLDSAGRNQATGALMHPYNRGADLSVDVKPHLADGTYLVVWRVTAEDSHPSAGSFSFSVGRPGDVAVAHSSAVGNQTVTAMLGFGRLLGFVGIATFFGGVVFLLRCWPAGRHSAVAGRTLQAGWLLGFIGAVATLLLQGPYGSGESIRHALDPSLVSGVAHTRYGRAIVARVVLLALAAGAGRLVLRRTRAAQPVFAVLMLATLATFPYTGHPSVGSQVPLAVASDVLHLAAMSVWLGGLLQLAVVVLPDQDDATVREVARAFSPIAMTSVLILVVTGTYQAWREAGVVASLPATHYGNLLLAKTAIVVVVLLVAELSRRWVGAAAGSSTQPPNVRRLGLSVSLEAALAVIVLAVTSLLVAATPARTDYRPSSDLRLVAGPVHLQLSVRPSASRVVDVRVDTTDASGRPLDVDGMTLSLSLPSAAAGPVEVALAAIGPTQFQASDVELPYSGHWTASLVVRTTETQEWTGRAVLDVR